ncbi:hypothetical protein [Kurthia gibsonii]|uniref:hypothetical protein n=1 Tax=Kurthia gibsonii TaxID=33946 RepID=UPI00114112AD|nr:hypothetical protein [Kurthia gibsonii]MEB7773164.1 hypothetical protein [Kurthia gibsonii]GED18307.1 hypothetical protein KGI01_00480 [Kurthia gibsonii]
MITSLYTISVLVLIIVLIVFLVKKRKAKKSSDLESQVKVWAKRLKITFSVFIVLLVLNIISGALSEDTEDKNQKEASSEEQKKSAEDIAKESEKEYKDYTEQSEKNDKKKLAIGKEIVAELSKLQFEKDEVEDRTWYYNSYLTNDRTIYQSYPYLSLQGDILDAESYVEQSSRPKMVEFVRFSYSGDDWLFAKDKIVVKTDSDKHTLYTEQIWSRDNSGGGVWEWYDYPVKEDTDVFMDMASSKKTIYRLEGNEYYNDHTLSQNEKNALKQITSIYEKYNKLFELDRVE